MKIPIMLNNNKVTLEYKADETLLEVLRSEGCLSVKRGCTKGSCGACTVLLDGNPVPSCKVPISIVRGAEIVTLEYFSKTNEYRAIIEGFRKAGISMCGYCNASKIFGAYQILCMKKKLSREEIKSLIENTSPCCTDLDNYLNGIIYAIKFSQNQEKK